MPNVQSRKPMDFQEKMKQVGRQLNVAKLKVVKVVKVWKLGGGLHKKARTANHANCFG